MQGCSSCNCGMCYTANRTNMQLTHGCAKVRQDVNNVHLRVVRKLPSCGLYAQQKPLSARSSTEFRPDKIIALPPEGEPDRGDDVLNSVKRRQRKNVQANYHRAVCTHNKNLYLLEAAPNFDLIRSSAFITAS